MIIPDKLLAVTFFFYKEKETDVENHFLSKISATDVQFVKSANAPTNVYDLSSFIWAGMNCFYCCKSKEGFEVATIFFSKNAFLNIIEKKKDSTIDSINDEQLLEIFVDDCKMLGAKVAYFTTHLNEIKSSLMGTRRQYVILAELDKLIEDYPGLIFLETNLFNRFSEHINFKGRELKIVDVGALIFAGKGNYRWF